MATREDRIQWLADVFSGSQEAISDAQIEEHVLDRSHVFGIEQVIEQFRPLRRLHESRDSVEFYVGAIDHRDPDRSYAEFLLDNQVALNVYFRFEQEPPYRMRYYAAHPPLPPGVTVRPYQPSDAPGCVELEKRCPMEFADGSRWIVDRGEQFDDYLRLAAHLDAVVVVHEDGRVLGFYSTTARPITLHGEQAWCAYQHHYRVDPDFRGASVSMALSTHLDARRSFEHLNAQFPYSMVDPRNVRMQGMGFPPVEGVTLVRLSIPVTVAAENATLRAPATEEICEFINRTHGERALFRTCTPATLADRWGRADGYTAANFSASDRAVVGIWEAQEHNLLDNAERSTELCLAFALDYGFETPGDLVDLIETCAVALANGPTTHVCFLLDERAEEYEALRAIADDEQRFAVHTLPWMGEVFSTKTVYCDGVYC